MEQELDPTAVVTSHDIRAAGVMDALKQAGIRVPEKIIGVFVVRAERANPEWRNRRGDRSDCSAHPRPCRANPVTAVPPGYYAEHSEQETQLFGSPRNAEGTF